MKKYLKAAMVLVLVFGLMQSVSFAEGRGKGHKRKSFKDKFFKKIHMVYVYQEELGVSDKQLDQISDLKVALKKDLIKKKADIDIIKVDARSLLYEDEIDLKAVNALIDQKYDIKKAKAKKIAESYAQLKKILSKEQLDKMKSILLEKKKTCGAKSSAKGSRSR